MKQTIPLLFASLFFISIIGFSYCGNKDDKPTGLKAQLRDTAIIDIHYANWTEGVNGTHADITVRRVVDSTIKFGSIDSTVEKGVIKYSQEKKVGLDTIYFYFRDGWQLDSSKVPLSDSLPGSHRIIYPIRLPTQFIKETSEIHQLLVYNPFKPVFTPDTTSKKKDSITQPKK